jgi:hypothetical protein
MSESIGTIDIICGNLPEITLIVDSFLRFIKSILVLIAKHFFNSRSLNFFQIESAHSSSSSHCAASQVWERAKCTGTPSSVLLKEERYARTATAAAASVAAAASAAGTAFTKDLCNWISVGTCLCVDGHPGLTLNSCHLMGCQKKLHHLCQVGSGRMGDKGGTLENVTIYALHIILPPVQFIHRLALG